MEKKTQNITLTVDGNRIPLTIEADYEFAYREAARKLNERIDFLAQNYPQNDFRTILIVAALEKAIDYEKLRLGGLESNLTDKIEKWDALIDAALAPK